MFGEFLEDPMQSNLCIGGTPNPADDVHGEFRHVLMAFSTSYVEGFKMLASHQHSRMMRKRISIRSTLDFKDQTIKKQND